MDFHAPVVLREPAPRHESPQILRASEAIAGRGFTVDREESVSGLYFRAFHVDMNSLSVVYDGANPPPGLDCGYLALSIDGSAKSAGGP